MLDEEWGTKPTQLQSQISFDTLIRTVSVVRGTFQEFWLGFPNPDLHFNVLYQIPLKRLWSNIIAQFVIETVGLVSPRNFSKVLASLPDPDLHLHSLAKRRHWHRLTIRQSILQRQRWASLRWQWVVAPEAKVLKIDLNFDTLNTNWSRSEKPCKR